jgi:hypothetical protein
VEYIHCTTAHPAMSHPHTATRWFLLWCSVHLVGGSASIPANHTLDIDWGPEGTPMQVFSVQLMVLVAVLIHVLCLSAGIDDDG